MKIALDETFKHREIMLAKALSLSITTYECITQGEQLQTLGNFFFRPSYAEEVKESKNLTIY